MKVKFSHSVFLFTIITLFTFEILPAQTVTAFHIPDSGFVQILQATDGSVLYGRTTHVNNEEIEFASIFGTFTIDIQNIESIQDIPSASFQQGKYWEPNPNKSRLFFAPKANMLEEGEGYFQDIYVFFVGFAVGLSDNITIGGGTSLMPGVGIDEQIFYLTPKVGIKSTEKFHLALGALLARIPGDDENTVGILYGVGTIGTNDTNATLGIGYGFEGNEFADKPMLMLGCEGRVSSRTALVSENWIFPGMEEPLISYGLRFFGEKMAVDLAFINFLGDESLFPGIPFIDFVYNF